jgi:hypothetical protein
VKDPIVEEIHAIRRQIAKECGYDMHRLLKRQQAIFAAWKGKKATEPFHPEWRPPRAQMVAEAGVKYEVKSGGEGRAGRKKG